MKKILLFSLLTVVLLTISGCENGLSHDGNGVISVQNIRSVTLDPVAGCTLEEVHQHNGVYYSGHYNNDGHGHHGLEADDICIIAACGITGLHEHDGIHYAGHHSSDGHYGNDHHGGNNGHHS